MMPIDKEGAQNASGVSVFYDFLYNEEGSARIWPSRVFCEKWMKYGGTRAFIVQLWNPVDTRLVFEGLSHLGRAISDAYGDYPRLLGQDFTELYRNLTTLRTLACAENIEEPLRTGVWIGIHASIMDELLQHFIDYADDMDHIAGSRCIA